MGRRVFKINSKIACTYLEMGIFNDFGPKFTSPVYTGSVNGVIQGRVDLLESLVGEGHLESLVGEGHVGLLVSGPELEAL